jgi:hypothetical protein
MQTELGAATMTERWHGFVAGFGGKKEFCMFCGEPEKSYRHDATIHPPVATQLGRIEQHLEGLVKEVKGLSCLYADDGPIHANYQSHTRHLLAMEDRYCIKIDSLSSHVLTLTSLTKELAEGLDKLLQSHAAVEKRLDSMESQQITTFTNLYNGHKELMKAFIRFADSWNTLAKAAKQTSKAKGKRHA